jgi:heat shock protein HtpX
MWLQTRMYLLIGLMFAIVYALIATVASSVGVSNFLFYAILAVLMLFIQYLVGPNLIELSMGISYVSEEEAPELHQMVSDLALKAGIKKPRVAVSRIKVPNAFAFGRSISDGRVCVTEGILKLLSRDELKAVLGHELSHIKNRDVATMTMLSVVPIICWYIAWSFMFSGRRDRGNAILIGVVAFILYFITNLLVLYGSRIREYYADRGSVALGNAPHQLASALYKLVYGSARAPKDAIKQMEGYKAFFLNDPSKAMAELNELSEIDSDMSGTVDREELLNLRGKEIKVGSADHLMELLSTHPNMLKRIKHLSTLSSLGETRVIY